MTNFEYLKSLDIELFCATLAGLMGIPLGNFEQEQVLMDWLNAPEEFTKEEE